MQSDIDQTVRTMGMLLDGYLSVFNIAPEPVVAQIAVQSLMQFDPADVREAIAQIITSEQRIEYGQSHLGVLVARAKECRLRRLERRAAQMENLIAAAPPEESVSLREFLTKNPDSPIRNFARCFREEQERDGLGVEQMAEKKRAQLRALQRTEERKQA